MHPALASSSIKPEYKHRQGRGGHVESKLDYTMSVIGNTHLEATKSLLCFVVVWRGITGCSSSVVCCTNKVFQLISVWPQDHYSRIHCASSLPALIDVKRLLFYWTQLLNQQTDSCLAASCFRLYFAFLIFSLDHAHLNELESTLLLVWKVAFFISGFMVLTRPAYTDSVRHYY